MIIADQGTTLNITIWRGDISATTFDLRVVNTTSAVVTLFEGLRDITPTRITINLVPPAVVWNTLPNGEYEYFVEDNGRVVSAGLLRNIKNKKNNGYKSDHYYTEYRE